MSKLKSPQEKKKTSLQQDCRNAYGENDKASRKLIPLRKRMSHQAERRTVNAALGSLRAVTVCEEARVDSKEQIVRDKTTELRREGFKKKPDVPLKLHLEHQRTGRWFEKRDR